MTGFRLTNACLLPMAPRRAVLHGGVAVDAEGQIVAVGNTDAFLHWPAIDCQGDWLMPGFVQPHIHLCQTLFRHHAESRPLLRWLHERIWPLEGGHTEETLAVSAELGIAELLLGGTTCLLDMGTVHHQEALCEVVERSGIRAAVGKAMMDQGEGVPGSLLESTDASLQASVDLATRWHGRDRDRIRYAFAPRFILACSEALQREVGSLSAEHGWLIHTHANEQVEEIAVVERLWGRSNIEALDALGLCTPRSVFAHGVHLSATEREVLARTGAALAHCPSSNLKLGSGIADLHGLWQQGIRIGIAADGAPCNNGLDAWTELRLAALLQCMRAGPGALDPADLLHMATLGGAALLGWDHRVGSLEVGKDADMLRIRRDDLRLGMNPDPFTALVYSGSRDLVRDVWVRGRHLVHEGQVRSLDTASLRARGERALHTTMERAGLH